MSRVHSPSGLIPTELLERLSAATAGSLDLDKAILASLGFTWRGMAYWNASNVMWNSPTNPTQSLDAALALAERVLPGCYWRVHRLPPLEAIYAPFWATFGPAGEQEAATGNTAPLALCIAILKARTAAETGAVGIFALRENEQNPPGNTSDGAGG